MDQGGSELSPSLSGAHGHGIPLRKPPAGGSLRSQLLLRHSLGLVVLELDVQAVLDAHFHLDGGVELGVGAQRVHNDVHLLDHVVQPAAHGGTEEIPAGTVPCHQVTAGTRAGGLGLCYPSSLTTQIHAKS